jgi:hypothetical protein
MATQQASSAAAFVDSLGVNTHIDFQNYGYQNFAVTEAAIRYLGLTNLRDDPENPADVGPNGWWQQVADATGAKFDAFLAEGSPSRMMDDLGLATQLAGQGILNYLEGGNEEDDPYAAQNGNSLGIAANYQPTVYAAAHSLGLPAINMSFGQGWTSANDYAGNYDKVGNLAGSADYANAHTYPANTPLSTIQLLNRNANMAANGRPPMQTEFGYDTNGTDVTQAAKWDLMGVMDSFLAGDVKTYFYALFDDGSGAFGLMNQDGSPKAPGLAIHNLTSLLKDTGGNAATFAPGTLDYTLNGGSGDSTLLMEKSDGSYWLSVWNESAGAHTDTLTLGAAASQIMVFDPLTGTDAVQTLSNTATAQIQVPDHPVLIEVINPGTAAGAGSIPVGAATGGTSSDGTTTGGTTTDGSTPGGTATGGTTTGGATPSGGAGTPQDLAVTVPTSLTAAAGATIPIAGVAIDDAWAQTAGGTMALNIYDKSGTITIGGQTFGPGGSNVPGGMLIGTEAELNADLASLSYQAGAEDGSDTLTIDVWNQTGVEVTKTIPVAVGAASPGDTAPGGTPTDGTTSGAGGAIPGGTSPAGSTAAGAPGTPQDLAVAVPPSLTAAAGATIPVAGVAIDDAWAQTVGGTMALNVYDKSGTVTLGGQTFGPGGSNAPGGMLAGTEAELNAALANLSYQAGADDGTDTLTIDVCNQAGVEVTKTIQVHVGAPTPADSTPAGTVPDGTTSGVTTGGTTTAGGTAATPDAVIPDTPARYATDISDKTIGATAGDHMIFISGTGDTLTATGGAETVKAFQGNNVFTTGTGDDAIYFAGSNNVIDAGSGSNTLYDSGSDNMIVLPAAGQGTDTIYGFVMQNGDDFDLRGVLSATKWDGSASTIGNFVKLDTNAAGDAVVSVDPTGVSGGSSVAVATLVGAGAVPLSTLMSHSITQ